MTRIYTDQAVLFITPNGVSVRETFGCTLEELQDLVPVELLGAGADALEDHRGPSRSTT